MKPETRVVLSIAGTPADVQHVIADLMSNAEYDRWPVVLTIHADAPARETALAQILALFWSPVRRAWIEDLEGADTIQAITQILAPLVTPRARPRRRAQPEEK